MASPNYAQGQSVAGQSASPEDQYKFEDYQEPGDAATSKWDDHSRATFDIWMCFALAVITASESSGSKSPFGSSLKFLRNLSNSKTTKDGQLQKRRGPKPDSKPALTRRQELNRQAQRTHRERKEMYIKALEQEVLRIRDSFTSVTRERDFLTEENNRLKALLASHGIVYNGPPSASGTHLTGGGSDLYSHPSEGSVSGSQQLNSAITGLTSVNNMSGYHPGQQQQKHPSVHMGVEGYNSKAPEQPRRQAPGVGRQGQGQMDLDQIGIDFVLTLERPCMDHMQPLMVKSNESEIEACGHALMATCPPQQHIDTNPDEPYPYQVQDVPMPDLVKLLDLSNRLPLDGEITPIMAWASIRGHERAGELRAGDYRAIKDGLSGKVRCYGFGAVLEEFELRDALNNVLSVKPGQIA